MAAHEAITQTEQLVIVSNLTVAIATIALVIVTALCAYYAYKDRKESNRHEEHIVDGSESVTKDLTKLIHEVLIEEQKLERSESTGKHHA